jgi:hypothetical protein
MAAAAFGGLFGRTLDWGRPIALICVLVLLRQLAYSRHISARLAGLLAAGISLWVLTAAARSTISTPETSRYIYLGAVVIVLVGVELLRGAAIRPRVIALAALVIAFGAVTGLTLLHNGAVGLRTTSKTVTAELGALELAAAYAPPGYQPDPQRAPQIVAGPYLHTVRAIGSSPADSPPQIAASDPVSRAAADGVLLALEQAKLTLLSATRPSSVVPAPRVSSLVSGTAIQRGSCVGLSPQAGVALTGTLTLPTGSVAIANHGAGSASASLKRFGESFQPIPGEVAPHSQAALRLPSLGLPSNSPTPPWELQVSSSSPLSVCGLPA